MIDAKTMLTNARCKAKSAANESWHNRGGVVLEGELKEIPIKTWKGKVFGQATVGYYKFKKNPANPKNKFHSDFLGFVMAACFTKGNDDLILETSPVCGKLGDNQFENTAISISRRFCINCDEIDSVKTTARKIAPECVEITYKCSECGYAEFDILD